MTMPPQGRLAGIDFGTVRIGIAITDPGRQMASPLENYTRGNRQQDERRLRRLIEEEELVGFVIGLPVHGSGQESRLSIEARKFGAWLAELSGLPVEYYDERFTSMEAEQLLLEGGMSRKRRRARLDKLAAQIMLSSYLQSRPENRSQPGSLQD